MVYITYGSIKVYEIESEYVDYVDVCSVLKISLM